MKQKNKSILFLSGIDFKEKSIQVIRKTPEAYVQRGWKVHYIVLRDYSQNGNYFYESIFNPNEVNVTRSAYPFFKILNLFKGGTLRTIVNKIIVFLGSFKLAYLASKSLKEEPFSVVCGYENTGVLAVKWLKLIGKLDKAKTISRFQGTWLTQYLDNKQWFKFILNIDFILGMKLETDLAIMTDDGTQGDKIFKILNPRHPNFKFWTNGVNIIEKDSEALAKLKQEYQITDEKVFVSISRLEGWKRVDRIIHFLGEFKKEFPNNRFKYLIIGEGQKREELEEQVILLNLKNEVIFTGPLEHHLAQQHLHLAEVFFSFYDLSNVGNPLLEAIRANKIIFTLNNGDTGSWIKHKETGFIYNSNENFAPNVVKDLDLIYNNSDIKDQILLNLRDLAQTRLKNWEERFDMEVQTVESLTQ